MAINKVEFGGQTLIDLTNDTVTPEKLMAGETAHDRSGTPIVGTAQDNKVPKTDIATVEPTNTASRAYSVGELIYVNGNLYKVIIAIANGATFTVGTNIQSTNVSERIKSIDYSVETVSTGAVESANCRFVYTEKKWGHVVWVHVEISVNTTAGTGIGDVAIFSNLVNVPPVTVVCASSNDISSSDYGPHAMGMLSNNKTFSLRGAKTKDRGGAVDFVYLV